MLGVQTDYARAASPIHLLHGRLHRTESYQLYLIESRSITIQEKKKRIAIDLPGEEDRKVNYDSGQ